MFHDRDAGRYNPFFTRASGSAVSGATTTTNNTGSGPNGTSNNSTNSNIHHQRSSSAGAAVYSQSLSRLGTQTLRTTTTVSTEDLVWGRSHGSSFVNNGGRGMQRTSFASTTPPLLPAIPLPSSDNEEKLAAANEYIRQQTSTIEKFSQELTDCRNECKTLRLSTHQSHSESSHQSNELRRLREENKNYFHSLSSAEGERAELIRQTQTLQEKNAALSYQLSQQKSQLSAAADFENARAALHAERSAAHAREEELRRLLQEQTFTIESLRTELITTRTTHSQLLSETSEAAATLNATRSALEASTVEVEALQLSLAQARRELSERLVTVERLERERVTYTTTISTLQTQVIEYRVEVEQVRALAVAADENAVSATQERRHVEEGTGRLVKDWEMLVATSRRVLELIFASSSSMTKADDDDDFHNTTQALTQELRALMSYELTPSQTSSQTEDASQGEPNNTTNASSNNVRVELYQRALAIVAAQQEFLQMFGEQSRQVRAFSTERQDLKDALVTAVGGAVEVSDEIQTRMRRLVAINDTQEKVIEEQDEKIIELSKDYQDQLQTLQSEHSRRQSSWESTIAELVATQQAYKDDYELLKDSHKALEDCIVTLRSRQAQVDQEYMAKLAANEEDLRTAREIIAEDHHQNTLQKTDASSNVAARDLIITNLNRRIEELNEVIALSHNAALSTSASSTDAIQHHNEQVEALTRQHALVIDEYLRQLNMTEEQLREATQEIAQLTSSSSASVAALRQTENDLAISNALVAALQKQLEELVSQLSVVQNSQSTTEVQQQLQQQQQLHMADEYLAQLTATESQLHDATQQIARLTATSALSVSSLSGNVATLQSTIASRDEELRRLRQQVDEYEEIQSLVSADGITSLSTPNTQQTAQHTTTSNTGSTTHVNDYSVGSSSSTHTITAIDQRLHTTSTTTTVVERMMYDGTVSTDETVPYTQQSDALRSRVADVEAENEALRAQVESGKLAVAAIAAQRVAAEEEAVSA
ncbi:Hypothetical protein, putative, partial [Bodo saltans]